MYLTLKEIYLTTPVKIRILVAAGFLLFIGALVTASWMIRNWLRVEPFEGDGSELVESLPAGRVLPDEFLSGRLSATARAVLENHLRMIGGTTRLNAVNSVLLTGVIDLGQGEPWDIVVVKKGNTRVRVTISREDQAIVMAVAPGQAWTAYWQEGRIVMLRDLTPVEEASFTRYRAMVSDLFLGSLENWETRYLGLRPFADVAAHLFEMTPNPHLRMQFYIDPTTYQLLGKTEFIEEEDGKRKILTATHHSVRTFDGIQFPTVITTESNVDPTQRLVLENVVVNGGVLNESFHRPNPEDHWLIPLSELRAQDLSPAALGPDPEGSAETTDGLPDPRE